MLAEKPLFLPIEISVLNHISKKNQIKFKLTLVEKFLEC